MSSLNETPRANRTHIAFFGKTNAGKSTVVNALTGQDISLVSDIAGTTTDPVYKSMELLPMGPVVIIDTAGLGDSTALGQKRMEKTRGVADKADIGIIVISSPDTDISPEEEYISLLKKKKTPVIAAINVFPESDGAELSKKLSVPYVFINAKTGEGIDALKKLITSNIKDDEQSLVSDLVKKGDKVVLVMPQDIQAPKGRLILPQVQMIRELLDCGCKVFCIKTEDVDDICSDLCEKPALIICDSQIFKKVYEKIGKSIPLTSFSVLMSKAKGDIKAFVRGASVIESLKPGDSILILEACTHHALDGDIAREKLPKLLEAFVGGKLNVEVYSGPAFPKDISKYKLAITCGGCMINRKNMLSRISDCEEISLPITNFGVAIAYVSGILDKIVY